MLNPNLFLQYTDLQPTDFDIDVIRICFITIFNLYQHGVVKMTPLEVDQEIIQKNNGSTVKYKANGGLMLLNQAYEHAEPQNFAFYYNRVRKYSLLRRLRKEKYDISDYYRPDGEILSPLEEIKLQEKLDDATLDEILNTVEGKYNLIKNEYLGGSNTAENPAENIRELIDELQAAPNYGPALEGELFNAAVRGARAGCMYLKSASSSAGKSRTAVFDACKICYPIKYSWQDGTFIQEINPDTNQIREARKVLFIVTEMDKEELQTIMLAYLSGVDESHIIEGQYSNEDELNRVYYAAKIIQTYQDYFFIAAISDPNLVNVSTVIKKHITVDHVKFIFYDYIHTTGSMMEEFERNGLNEATVLMMMANQLKQLARDYNVFISTATQVNMTAMGDTGEFKNELSIRSSKAVADKCDVGVIMSRIGEKAWNELLVSLRQAVNMGKLDAKYIMDPRWKPTHIIDIYKMRRGRYKNVRIWTYLHLGTGERQDLFITTAGNEPINDALTYFEEFDIDPIENWVGKE